MRSSPGTWTFTSSALTIDYGTVFTGTYQYDGAPSPAQIDLMLSGQPTNTAIYMFSGSNLLTLKVLDGATERATDFSVEGGYDVLVLARGP